MSWINKEDCQESNTKEKKYPFSKWVSWLFLVASMALMAYTYYRAEIIFNGDHDSEYFKYYLISLTGILFWGVVLRLRAGIRANIVTVVTSLVFGLYMVEGGLRLWEYDERSRVEVIEDLIAKGIDAVPAVRPTDVLAMNKELLPLGGISNKTTVASNENGYYMVYPSDRYGFNNPDSDWDAEQVEWLLTGDSFTEGVAVNPGEDIAGQIRLITKQPTINVGRAGNGPLTELAELREYAELVKSKRVLWIYWEGNDLMVGGDLQRDKANPLLMQYMEDGFSQNLFNRQKEIDSRLGEYVVSAKAKAQPQPYARLIRLQTIRRMIGFDIVDDDDDVEVEVEVDPLFAKILIKAKAQVEGWGGELYFVYLPEYSRYNDKNILHDSFRKKSQVISLVKSLDIPVVDIHKEVFAKHGDPLALFPFRLNGHYNADGYAEVAKAIVDGVKKHEP